MKRVYTIELLFAFFCCFQVVKKLWAYIRENNLQDQSNKRKILCDDRLKKLFNVNSIDMFQMNKALTKHIWPLNSDGISLSTPTLKCHLNCRKKTMGTNLNINIEYEFSHLRVNVMKSVKVITAEASLPFASTVPYSVLGLGCQHTLQPS